MTTAQTAVTIAVLALGTLITRALPFICFPEGKKIPPIIEYLANTLPCAAMAFLVVYCFKDTKLLSYPYGLPKIIAAAFVVVVHLWKKNTLFSIFGGTAVYMVLLRIF
ncbi:MAG TPA: branched-chain amino acid transporter AzlD [Clostridiales bacterium]|nr:branched-chain amino acid transporter AzlD [Clostridiales bacterium]